MQSYKSSMSITGELTSRVFSVFSANLVVIPFLRTLKNIQAKKMFLITPQNEVTLQRKQISKVI